MKCLLVLFLLFINFWVVAQNDDIKKWGNELTNGSSKSWKVVKVNIDSSTQISDTVMLTFKMKGQQLSIDKNLNENVQQGIYTWKMEVPNLTVVPVLILSNERVSVKYYIENVRVKGINYVRFRRHDSPTSTRDDVYLK
jgi:hypothetical protein